MRRARARANYAVPDRLRPVSGRPGYRPTPAPPKPETPEDIGRRLANQQICYRAHTVSNAYYRTRRFLMSDHAAELPMRRLRVLRAYWAELSECVANLGGPMAWHNHYGQ